MKSLAGVVLNNLPQLNTYTEVTDNTIEILFAGNAMPIKFETDYTTIFKYIEDDIKNADLSCVNLESIIYKDEFAHKNFPGFKESKSFVKALKNAGFKYAFTATNHAYDGDVDGVKETIDVLDEVGLWHSGTYKNELAREKHTPSIIRIKDIRIAFINYTYGLDGVKFEDSNVNIFMGPDGLLRQNKLEDEINKAKMQDVDLICCVMHWGKVDDTMPNNNQKVIAKWLHDKGVDMVIGTHPGQPQQMEMRVNERTGENELTVYSLGNFTSDTSKDATHRGSAIVKVTVSRDTKKIIKCEYKLTFINKSIYNDDNNYYVLPINKQNILRKDNENDYNIFINNAHNMSLSNNIGVTEQL